MKLRQQRLWLLCLLATITITLQAQVTIGSKLEPNKGALLDLKENANAGVNSTKGMLLPRVALNWAANNLAQSLNPSADASSMDGPEHAGLTVYSTSDDYCNGNYPGPYVWDGEKWNYLGKKKEFEVKQLVDKRDDNVYYTREFFDKDGNSAGTWMLENLRYVPKAKDGYDDYTYGFNGLYLPVFRPEKPGNYEYLDYHTEDKYYAYTRKGTGVMDASTLDSDKNNWDPQTGIIYNYAGAVNRIGPYPNEDRSEGIGRTTTTPLRRGVCPEGWHIPSDEDWNILLQAIYNNPTQYSYYTPSQAFEPETWDQAWNTNSNQGSSNTYGHGIAMISCEFGGLSLPAKHGGFDAKTYGFLRVNSPSGGTFAASYLYYDALAYFTTSSYSQVAVPGTDHQRVSRISLSLNKANVKSTRGLSFSPDNMISVRCMEDPTP